ncbi:unnamed protein product [Adineta ricciae]|uniref:Uncharacterized protein n=1 Tax=Adineta ricciae TaxID=249248 RepID=A0A815U5P9_ADIRI|nr:unnamed protein product [Adineta ricciae]
MKVLLLILIVCFSCHYISGFSWFNSEVKQVTKSVTTQRTTVQRRQFDTRQQNPARNFAHIERQAKGVSKAQLANRTLLQQALLQRKNNIRNSTIAQRQADSVRKQNSQTVSQNRLQERLVNQQRNRFLNQRPTQRQVNRTVKIANSRLFNSRYRPFVKNNKTNNQSLAANRRMLSQVRVTKNLLSDSKKSQSSIAKNVNARSSPNRPLYVRYTAKYNNTNHLHRTLITQVVQNNKVQHQQRSNLVQKSTLAQTNAQRSLLRRKRQHAHDDTAANPFNSMVLARDAPVDGEDDNLS